MLREKSISTSFVMRVLLFIVKTKDFQVQVLGTVFNVSAYPSEGMSSVVLVKGKCEC